MWSPGFIKSTGSVVAAGGPSRNDDGAGGHGKSRSKQKSRDKHRQGDLQKGTSREQNGARQKDQNRHSSSRQKKQRQKQNHRSVGRRNDGAPPPSSGATVMTMANMGGMLSSRHYTPTRIALRSLAGFVLLLILLRVRGGPFADLSPYQPEWSDGRGVERERVAVRREDEFHGARKDGRDVGTFADNSGGESYRRDDGSTFRGGRREGVLDEGGGEDGDFNPHQHQQQAGQGRTARSGSGDGGGSAGPPEDDGHALGGAMKQMLLRKGASDKRGAEGADVDGRWRGFEAIRRPSVGGTIEEKAAMEAGVKLGMFSGGNDGASAADDGDKILGPVGEPDKDSPIVKSRIIPADFESKFEDVYAKDESTVYLPIFWHVLKSGGTSAKELYAKCMKKVEASEVGIWGGHDKDKQLQIMQLKGGERFVNVDASTAEGLKRAKDMGLVQSKLADIVFTPLLHEAAGLFSGGQKGRVFAIFRHPIERSTSLFYYLQKATWEPTYNPGLANITIEEYAGRSAVENNWMTRSLVNKMSGPLTGTDLFVAKEIIQRKFLVGLMSNFDESWERFNKYFGWKDDTDEIKKCKTELLHGGANQNKHRKVEPGSLAWERLKQNQFVDIQLYEFVVKLFEQQAVLV